MRGPLGLRGISADVQDGTLVRGASPRPSPVGTTLISRSKPNRRVYKRIHIPRSSLPTLRQGVQDNYVRWLQILLNLHEAAQPPLRPDGRFGPKTHDAVINFQKSVSLKPDGVVGMKTWLKVQLIQAELEQAAPLAEISTSPPKRASQSEIPSSVADWSLTRRFVEVVELAPNHMKRELAVQFRAMLTPLNLTILVGTLVAWAVSHACGVGEAADVVFAVVGTIFMGLAVFRAGWDLGDCLVITVGAREYPDLDTASDRLAEAVAILGVVAFFALIAKIGAKFKRSASAGEQDVVPQEKEPAPQIAPKKAPKAAPEEQVTEPSTEPARSTPQKPPLDPKYQDTLNSVDAAGKAPAGYKGGRRFLNDGRAGGEQLPQTDANGNPIEYREWDVNPKQPGINRGGERLVTGSDGSAYATDNHYLTFTRMR